MKTHTISGYTGSGEREMFRKRNTFFRHCRFDPPGESPIKDGVNIQAENCDIRARYAFWEDRHLLIDHCILRVSDRAPLWYTKDFTIRNTRMYCPKGIRESSGMKIHDSVLHGIESIWQVTDFDIDGFDFVSYYPFLECSHGKITHMTMKGKYSFQHCHDIEISDSNLDTKDAFWHSYNITVKDSIVKGEYVAWYSHDITFIRCRISGTQPFVSAKNLKFIDCTFAPDTDRAFEKSTASGTLKRLPFSIYDPKDIRLISDDKPCLIVIDHPKRCRCQIRRTRKA
jgi:hypothetical protein